MVARRRGGNSIEVRASYHRIGNKILGDLAAIEFFRSRPLSETPRPRPSKLRPSPVPPWGGRPAGAGHHQAPMGGFARGGPAWAHPGILHSYASTPGAYDLNVGPCPGFDAHSKGQECIYLLGADFEINNVS